MIRLVIVAVAVVLVVGGVGAALSGAQDQDPGPAIVLDKVPVDDAGAAHDKNGADGAKKDRGERQLNVRTDDDPFSVAQPLPVRADVPDEPDELDEPDEPDEPANRTNPMSRTSRTTPNRTTTDRTTRHAGACAWRAR